ncbi:MAG: polysulfide reductase NrfD [Bacteroidia bacterium]|nr:polysulfide reductase NrfD [Bacteroidia bacterium]
MRIDSSTKEKLQKFVPILETFSTKWKIWVGFLVLCILFGLYALYLQIVEGHGVTGMRDNVVWGLFIVNFIFFIGTSYAGAVICSILHLLKVDWRTPIMRIGMLVTVSAAFIGPIFILLCVGRLDRLHYLFMYPRLQSPIVWDVFSISTFIIAGLLFLYLSLIKDFATYRDAEFLNVGKFRTWAYKTLSMGYKDKPEQRRQLAISMNLMSFILVPMVIIVSSVLSWIFGMTLRPGWHSSIFGPYFVLAAIYTGTGVIIVSLWVFRKLYKLDEYITDKHFRYLGYMMLALASAYGYFTFSEYLTSWYGSEKWEGEVMHKLFSPDEYGYWFLYANTVGIILPVLVMAFKATRKTGWIAFAAFFMVSAMWVKRYLIIVPTLESALIPIQDIRDEYVHYSATWVEWALTIGGMASFLLFMTLAAKFVTIIPVSKMPDFKNNPIVEAEKNMATS